MSISPFKFEIVFSEASTLECMLHLEFSFIIKVLHVSFGEESIYVADFGVGFGQGRCLQQCVLILRVGPVGFG